MDKDTIIERLKQEIKHISSDRDFWVKLHISQSELMLRMIKRRGENEKNETARFWETLEDMQKLREIIKQQQITINNLKNGNSSNPAN